MAKKTTLSYRMPNGATYKVQYRRYREGLIGPSYYRMKILDHPPCTYPLGVYSHLLDADFICVLVGREPRTIERAKAIACHWMNGFEVYRQSGEFPNGKLRVDVKEV